MPKYTLCKFRPEDTRSYTYLTGDTICAVGDEVMVPNAKGDGEKRVTVSGFTDDEPSFACKAIIGIAPPREESKEEAVEPASDPAPENPFGDA